MSWWLAGIVAGIIAGIVMAIVAMPLMVAIGRGMLAPIRLMASAIEGEDVDEDDTGDVVVGLGVHLAMSILAGWVFALIMHGLGWSNMATLIVVGIFYAVFVFIVNEVVTLRLFDQIMFRRMPPFSFLIAHLAYGVILGWLFALFM